MNTIKASIETIELTANQMETKALEFQSVYSKLVNCVENTSSFWSGMEQSSYLSKMYEFENELSKLYMLMNDYSTYLKKSAKSYQLTQDELVLASNRLKIY